MIRALYTAASGMNAQQANIDNVAHNLANVNTTGFKKSRVEFEDLVYQQIEAPGAPTSTATEAPIGLETGLGTRAGRARRATSPPATCARPAARSTSPIEGARLLPGDAARRRHRLHARRHVPPERARASIVTAEGYPLEPAITIPANATSISISKDGIVSVPIAGQQAAAAGRHDRARDVPEPGRACRRSAATSSRRRPRRARRTTGVPGTEGAAARWRRASSRTRTSASSRRWST